MGDATTEREQGTTRPRLIAFMNCYTEGMSGGDAYFIEIAKRLPDLDIIFVTSALGVRTCEARGLRCCFWVTTREAAFRHVIRTYVLRILKGLWLTLNIRPGDLIYSTSDFLPDVLPALFARFRAPGVQWVQRTYHMIPRDRVISHYAQRASHLLIKHAADLIIPDSNLLQRELIARGFPRERMEVNYVGLDLQFYTARQPDDSKEFDAVYLGRLHKAKGVFDLLDIWWLVCQARPGATLGLIGYGDPDTVAALRAQASARGLERNVALLGYLPTTDDAVAVLRRSRLSVSASQEEGFGMALLETMAVGLPVVTWALPVYREIFPVGLVAVPQGDRPAFAAAILALLADPALRERVCVAAREMMARYDWRRLADREQQLWMALARSPARAGGRDRLRTAGGLRGVRRRET